MYKKLWILLLALMLLCAPALALAETDPAPTPDLPLELPLMPADEPTLIGGSERDFNRYAFATDDAIYITCYYGSNDGTFAGENPTNNQIAGLIKLAPDGSIVWKYGYELQRGVNNFGPVRMQPDGTLLADFQWYGDNVDDYNMIFQWDTDGNLINSFELPGDDNLYPHDTGDGYFLADQNQGGPRILHWYDAKGNLLWTREYPELANCGYFFQRVEDGILLAGGKSGAGQTGPNYHMAAKLSLDGELLWQTLCGKSDFGNFQRFAVLPDGGLVAVGNYYLTDEDITGTMSNVRGYIARFAADGTLLWEQVVSAMPDGSPFPGSVDLEGVVAVEGGYLASGRIDRKLSYFLFSEDGEIKGVWRGDDSGKHGSQFLVSCAGSVYLVCTLREEDKPHTPLTHYEDTDIYVQRLRLDELE